jgi:multimeric flavodoxin WrbA
MKKTMIFTLLVSAFGILNAQKSEERKAILSMAGTYKVTFDFAETFSPDSGYKFYPKYHEFANEMVIVTVNTENKISLNHFLLVNDSMVIKHWRQDWIYENTEFLDYKGGNVWTKNTADKKEVKGTWTQKVFQIDESPRYEAFGKWTKQNNEWIWNASVCNSPLPRRELLKRDDYNVIKRRSRIVVGQDYWYLEQDNQKVDSNRLVCYEKGMERFQKSTFDPAHIVKWWSKNEKMWRYIAEEWNSLIQTNNSFQLSGTLIASDYQQDVFRFIKQMNTAGKTDEELKQEIRAFIRKNCTISLTGK